MGHTGPKAKGPAKQAPIFLEADIFHSRCKKIDIERAQYVRLWGHICSNISFQNMKTLCVDEDESGGGLAGMCESEWR